MRVNLEQWKQVIQAVTRRMQDKGSTGQEADFQEMIAQILSMMNMPVNEQTVQHSQNFPAGNAMVFRDRVMTQKSVVDEFMSNLNLNTIPQLTMAKKPIFTEPLLRPAIPLNEQQLTETKAGITGNIQSKPMDFEKTAFPETKDVSSGTAQSESLLFKGIFNFREGFTMPDNPAMHLPALDAPGPEAPTMDIPADGTSFTGERIAGVLVKNAMETLVPIKEASNDNEDGLLTDNYASVAFETGTSETKTVPRINPSADALTGRNIHLTGVEAKESEPVNFRNTIPGNKTDKAVSYSFRKPSEIDDEYRTDGKETEELSGKLDLQSSAPILKSRADSIQEAAVRHAQIQNLQDIEMQLAERFAILKEGEHTVLNMKLKPELLGEMEVRLRMKNGVITGEILVETLSVREAMESQLQNLKDRLRNQNIILNEVNISLYQNSQEQNRERRHDFYQGSSQEQLFFGQSVRKDDTDKQQLYPQVLPVSYYQGITGVSLDRFA
ncbi:MAG TPA: flagellar hook-length control protein FliK [Clostridiales bacterium]|nr:flagellar hook-length control protein FliK [Clostridiales bacterium]